MVIKPIIYPMVILALNAMNNCLAVKQNLKLSPNKPSQEVELPYPYKHLTPTERSNITYVPEGSYTTLNDLKDNQLALVGTLQPCLFVGIRNKLNNSAVVFHKHYSNRAVGIAEIAIKELNITSPSEIECKIFTNTMQFYAEGEPDNFKKCHKNKTQKEEIIYIRDTIISKLCLDKKQCLAQIYTSKLPDWGLGDYEMAELSVVADNQLNMQSLCVMHENIFGNFSSYPLHHRLNATVSAMKVQSMVREARGEKDYDLYDFAISKNKILS